MDDEEMGFHFAMAQPDEPDWEIAKDWMRRYPKHALFFLDWMIWAEWERRQPPAPPADPDEVERVVQNVMEKVRRMTGMLDRPE
jgi:hypothetical protein